MLRRIANTEHIGNITIKALRDYILDNSLSEEDTIIVNQINFDELALEYRKTYNEGIEIPFFILRVLVKEDGTNSVPFGRVMIILKDKDRYYEDYIPKVVDNSPNDSHEFDVIYRCGWCGNVVGFNGKELDNSDKSFQIKVLEKFNRTVQQPHITGYCCKNRTQQ